jgi:hypothetical protein
VLRVVLLVLLLIYFRPVLFADNGRVVHVAWVENKDGSISNASSAEHSLLFFEQRNQFLQYKDPNNPFFKIRYSKLGVDWTVVHVLALLFTITLQILTFRRINRRMRESRFFKRWSYRFLKLVLWFAVILGNIGTIWAIDYYNNQIHFRYHKLNDFNGASISELQMGLHNRTYFKSKESTILGNQLFIKRENQWHTQRVNPVLHFEVNKDGAVFFKSDKRYFKPHPDSTNRLAPTQLFIFHHLASNGQDSAVIYQLDQKQLMPYHQEVDHAQRILLLVNGYRPISTSHNPEKALQDINNKGLEHPNSANLIYRNDFYRYWPHLEMIEPLESRLMPEKIFYADGHHSVSSSNHNSLIQFVSSASFYPKPCKGPHTCSTTKIANQQKIRTYNLLATRSNKKGFMKRFYAGKQAGRNLLQELRKNGNNTQNDTLYVVSHSMGHAYFLGMSTVLSGKVKFGGYFAFAPENPKGKKIQYVDWPIVYQYGTLLYGPHRHAPCQQDGVAPQWRMSGLPASQQIGFPKELRSHLGYFNSHYIGYYTWALEIPKGQPGFIGCY